MNKVIPVLAMALVAVWAPYGFSFQSAYAGSDKSSNGCEHSNSHGSASCDDNSFKDSESKDGDSYSIQTPVCDCSGAVAMADEAATKAQDDYDKAKEDDDKAKEDSDKTILCHVPPGNSGNPQTLYLPSSGVSAHLREHADDYLGACVGDDSEQTKGYEESKSSYDKDKEDADKALEETSKAKDEADKNKSDMDVALAEGGDPCTCADGSTGTWIYGTPGTSATPTSVRQIRGQ